MCSWIDDEQNAFLVHVLESAAGVSADDVEFGGDDDVCRVAAAIDAKRAGYAQVNKLLLYMLPAMSTYSLPVAALFAATMVYGRFAADNELTAMRASGIGYISWRRFSIALPGLILGLFSATTSLLLLCFVVPIFSLKVEQVVRLNIAKVIVSRIEREHLVTFPGTDDLDIYAEAARLLPGDPAKPEVQQVEFDSPAMMDYEKVDGVKVPKDFCWVSRRS